ncbi:MULTISPECIES: XF1762 family protein [Bacillaceae]|uniref:XF1762 family protein n=1 Tax=Bacillaceae TaxID=186817 RepID=UPI001A8F79BF|nr:MULTISPECIES: XF1762 family protein [Bacillaceae]MBN8203906.1 hypothetical protein [Bacillus sp. NTK034]
MNWYWIFYKVKTNRYVIVSDEDCKRGEMWDLLQDGYDIVWDSAINKEMAKTHVKEQIDAYLDAYQKDYPLVRLPLEDPQPLTLENIPISFKEAKNFIDQHHRHCVAPHGHKFSVGLWDTDVLVGVAIAGLPIARHNNDGFTLEITRCCLKSSIYKNGVSRLISSIYQAGKAMGYRRIVTYTLDEESGVSLRACGFKLEGLSKGGSWNSAARPRIDKGPTGPKKKWVKQIS